MLTKYNDEEKELNENNKKLREKNKIYMLNNGWAMESLSNLPTCSYFKNKLAKKPEPEEEKLIK